MNPLDILENLRRQAAMTRPTETPPVSPLAAFVNAQNALQGTQGGTQAPPSATPPPPPPVVYPQPAVQQILADLQASQEKSTFIPEIKRITSLPIVPNLTQEQLDAFNYANTHANQHAKGWRWHDLQAKGILSYDKWSGLFGLIGCGWGKTAITLMIAYRAFKKGIRKSLLLVLPDVYNQLVKTDIPFIRERTPLEFPFIKLGRSDASQRIAAANSTRIGCYILPYSILSTKDASAILNAIAPQLIIADEAHTLKNRTAAKTKRLMEYVNANHPEFVALSGSMTTKGIEEYHHLIKAALGPNCPLPLTWQEAQDWGIVIDTSSSPGDEQMRPLTPLLGWARENFKTTNFTIDVAGYRGAFQKRLESAPGVVASGDKELGTSLIIRNSSIKCYSKVKQEDGSLREHIDAPGGKKLVELIERIDNEMKTPNGDEIDHSIHKFKWHYELASGFYYELTWPKAEKIAQDRTILVREAKTANEFTIGMAEKSLDAAIEHHEALQMYSKELRHFLLEKSEAGLDTPMLVGSEMLRNGPRRVGNQLYSLWMTARSKAIDPFFSIGPPNEDPGKAGFALVERQSKPISVCAYKIDAAAEWAVKCLQTKAPAGESRGGIIWTHHQHIGRWVYHAVKKRFVAEGADINKISDFVVYCPSGDESNKLLTNKDNHAALANKIIVASLAHRTGKNLQFLQRQLFVQWPRSAEWAEQSIARIHRMGQQADQVYVDTMNTTDFDYLVFSACLNDALYTHQSTGSRQKVIYAVYNPLPKIFPRAVLIEKGMQPRLVTGEAANRFDAAAEGEVE